MAKPKKSKTFEGLDIFGGAEADIERERKEQKKVQEEYWGKQWD